MSTLVRFFLRGPEHQMLQERTMFSPPRKGDQVSFVLDDFEQSFQVHSVTWRCIQPEDPHFVEVVVT